MQGAAGRHAYLHNESIWSYHLGLSELDLHHRYEVRSNLDFSMVHCLAQFGAVDTVKFKSGYCSTHVPSMLRFQIHCRPAGRFQATIAQIFDARDGVASVQCSSEG